jgi:pyruvate ferredoxin oxidoreductase alpha subunit
MPVNKNDKQLLNASEAIALVISRLDVGVVSAYPITPQTKIVEGLARLQSDKNNKYEFVRAESEYAAASIALGASAGGARAYTATSSQGLLFMLEVLYNIGGLRLPVVMTCANRAISAPLNIWNDHQDAFAMRDAGWLMFFAESAEEAAAQHILAYKLAEKLQLPANVNVDGFILTHTSEPAFIPTAAQIKKFLPKFKPASATHLNIKHPVSIGHLVLPKDYQSFRQNLNEALADSATVINREYALYQKMFYKQPASDLDNGLIEYYGPSSAKTVIIAMGSVSGTIKTALDEYNRRTLHLKKAALLRIKTFRPFPIEAVKQLTAGKKIVILNKGLSPGSLPPLSLEVASSVSPKTELVHAVGGLGGRDITPDGIIKLLNLKSKEKIFFL